MYGKDTNHSVIAYCYNNIGNVYDGLGKYDSSLENYTRSLNMMLAIYGENKNHPNIAECYSNIGWVHHNLSLYQSPRPSYSISLLHGKDITCPEFSASCFKFVESHQTPGKYNAAFACYNKALTMWPIRDGSCLVPSVLHRIAVAWVHSSDHWRAYQFLRIALAMVPESKKELRSNINCLMGTCLFSLKR